jgi:antitoxin component of MazEF toxin-antitoxin module
METSNFIKALKGELSLLLILPKEVSNKLDIVNQDLLKFEVKNRELVIKKIEIAEKDQKTRLGAVEL